MKLNRNITANLTRLSSLFSLLSIIFLYSNCAKGLLDFGGNGMRGNYEENMQGGDKYEDFADNPFIKTEKQNVSAFSVDADGASYAIMRSMLNSELLPPKAAVRIEEFLNYFTFDYSEPKDGDMVSINAETGDCPWNKEHKLLRLGLKGRTLASSEIPKANYVFLVDVSGSMNSKDKLDLLKAGLKTLTDHLNPNDRISIITYAGEVTKLLESTLASQASTIKNAIDKLQASGATAGGEAMKMAYEEALANYIDKGNNRVIMGTDGDFNVGVSDTKSLVEMVETYAKKGIYLTVCGFGRGNLNDSMMESVSNKGNGTYEYIDGEDELTKVFVNERGKLSAVANDSKVQITFDPKIVKEYRLIGYENRVMKKDDFNNDDKDAGEIGAGQTITALYEIVPAQEYTGKEELGQFNFKYKKALGEQSNELSLALPAVSAKPSGDFSFAAGVASFGMILRKSPYKGSSTYELSSELVEEGLGFDPYGYRKQFSQLIKKAKQIQQ